MVTFEGVFSRRGDGVTRSGGAVYLCFGRPRPVSEVKICEEMMKLGFRFDERNVESYYLQILASSVAGEDLLRLGDLFSYASDLASVTHVSFHPSFLFSLLFLFFGVYFYFLSGFFCSGYEKVRVAMHIHGSVFLYFS